MLHYNGKQFHYSVTGDSVVLSDYSYFPAIGDKHYSQYILILYLPQINCLKTQNIISKSKAGTGNDKTFFSWFISSSCCYGRHSWQDN